MYPTSPVMNTRSRRLPKSAIIACANSSRIAGPRHDSRVRPRQLVERLLVLRVVHRQVVGSDGVLHVPNTVTLDRVGDDDDGSIPTCVTFANARTHVARGQQRGEIMPLGDDDLEAECVELGA